MYKELPYIKTSGRFRISQVSRRREADLGSVHTLVSLPAQRLSESLVTLESDVVLISLRSVVCGSESGLILFKSLSLGDILTSLRSQGDKD